MEQNLTSAITIETKAPMRVACYRVISATPEDDVTRFMDEWIARHSPGTPSASFGFDVEVSPEQAKQGLRGYEIWRAVPPEVEPAEGVTIRNFPGGLYAVMTLYDPFEDPFQRIPGGWHQLHEWVISSDRYRSGSQQWLEELLHEGSATHLKLYHPVAVAE